MAYNRYRKREQLKRQYTFTTTKIVIGFILSAAFSICLSAYFERYGFLIFREVKLVVKSVFGFTPDAGSQSPGSKATAQSAPRPH